MVNNLILDHSVGSNNSPPAGIIICSQINLHKKAEANSDVVLMAEYLLNHYHINDNGVALGLDAFAPDFNYNYKDRDSSLERSDKNCGPTTHSNLPCTSPNSTLSHLSHVI